MSESTDKTIKEYSIVKVNQEKKMHIARMPDNFKAYPLGYLTKKGIPHEQKEFKPENLDIRDRNIILKKMKITHEKSKEIEYQYVLEDQDDVIERLPSKDNFARYNGGETKTDSKFYVLSELMMLFV